MTRCCVVGIDGSPDGDDSAPFRARGGPLARAPAARRLRLGGLRLGSYVGEAFAPTADVLLEAEHHAEEVLAQPLSRASRPTQPSQIEALSVEGHPATVLVEQARDAELLVVGSRGRGAASGLLLGSVSQSLAHHAPCPLVIVPERSTSEQGRNRERAD